MVDKTVVSKRDIIEVFEDSLFWIGLFCVLCSDLFEEVCFQNIISGGIVRKVGIICIVLKLLTDKSFLTLCLKDKCTQVFSIIFGLATYMATQDSTFFVLVIIIVAASGIDYSNIGKMYIAILGITFFLNIILVMFGIKNSSYIQASSGHFFQEQADLGFIHPNRALSVYLNILICLIIVFRDKLTNAVYFIYFLGSIILFYFTDSRAPMLAIIVVLLLIFVRNTKVKHYLCKYHISQIVFFGSIVFMVCLGCVFNGERIINSKFMSTFISRVMAWGRCVESLGFSLFGVGGELAYPVDCAFYRILFRFGICGFLLYLIFIYRGIFKNRDNYYYNVSIIGLCIISVFESRITFVQYVFPILAAFSVDKTVLADDNNLCHDENQCSRPALTLKYVNCMIGTGIAMLLAGHSILQHFQECSSSIVITGNGLFRIVDVLLIFFGLGLGFAIYRMFLYVNHKKLML